MIVGERKFFDEIKESIKGYKKVLILGCGTCVSVCMAGGEKEVELLASQMRMANELAGTEFVVLEDTIQRQCDREYIEPILEKARECDAVLSMACGAGVQLLAAMLPEIPVIPALNTRFIGYTEDEGVWSENCRACGDCQLGVLGGVCPVTICAKGLRSGPCGGASLGKCEAGGDRDCAWELIYKRLQQQGRLDNFKQLVTPRNYSLQSHPARVVKEKEEEKVG